MTEAIPAILSAFETKIKRDPFDRNLSEVYIHRALSQLACYELTQPEAIDCLSNALVSFGDHPTVFGAFTILERIRLETGS
jgi:hypothetical protein